MQCCLGLVFHSEADTRRGVEVSWQRLRPIIIPEELPVAIQSLCDSVKTGWSATAEHLYHHLFLINQIIKYSEENEC